MNTFFTCFSFFSQKELGDIAAVLLSTTCVGNDRKSCSLFHGSLTPMLFSRKSDDYSETLTSLLLLSHNITWATRANLSVTPNHRHKIIETLSRTRYSNRTIKSLRFPNVHSEELHRFIASHCQVLEEIMIDQDCFTWNPNALGINFGECNLPAKARTLQRVVILCSVSKNVVESYIKPLIPLRRLTDLKFSISQKLSDEIFEAISCIHSLEFLELPNDCCEVTDEGFVHLSNLHNLRVLKLNNFPKISSDVLTKTLSALSNLTSLDVIAIPQIPYSCFAKIAEAGVPLTSLALHSRNITDEDLIALSTIKTLRNLTVNAGGTNLTKAAFHHFAKNLDGSLESLSLSDAIRDENIYVELSGLRSLRHFTLNWSCECFTDRALANFAERLHNLESLILGISDCALTAEGLDCVNYKLKSLKLLDISNCVHFPTAVYEKLKRFRPELVVREPKWNDYDFTY
jgi:hypothetical protein